MFFVLSTGRSGSTSISVLLNRSSDVVCFHEKDPSMIAESTLYLTGEFSHDQAVQLLRQTRPEFVNEKIFGESNHNLATMIPALEEAFPTAKFIWLIRDGRSTVASFYVRGAYQALMGIQHRRSSDVRLWEIYRLTAVNVKEMSVWEWNKLSAFEKNCWYWTYKNRIIEQSLNMTSHKWMKIRLEDLETDQDKLFEFLEIKIPSDTTVPRSNVAKVDLGHRPSKWQDWSPQQIQAFHHFCGDAMDNWYPEWRSEVDGVWPDSSTISSTPYWGKIRNTITFPILRTATIQWFHFYDYIKLKYPRIYRLMRRVKRKVEISVKHAMKKS